MRADENESASRPWLRSVSFRQDFYLFVWVVDIEGGLGLVAPHALVKRLQEGALQQGQGALHLTPAQSEGLSAAGRVAEAQRTQLLHLEHHRNTPTRSSTQESGFSLRGHHTPNKSPSKSGRIQENI